MIGSIIVYILHLQVLLWVEFAPVVFGLGATASKHPVQPCHEPSGSIRSATAMANAAPSVFFDVN